MVCGWINKRGSWTKLVNIAEMIDVMKKNGGWIDLVKHTIYRDELIIRYDLVHEYIKYWLSTKQGIVQHKIIMGQINAHNTNEYLDMFINQIIEKYYCNSA